MISVYFQGKPFIIKAIQVYAPSSNAEEAEVEWLYEDPQDLLELTPPKDFLFIIGDWNEKVGNREIPGVTGKFGLRVQNEAGQRLTEFCQKNALVTANTFFNNMRDDFTRALTRRAPLMHHDTPTSLQRYQAPPSTGFSRQEY